LDDDRKIPKFGKFSSSIKERLYRHTGIGNQESRRRDPDKNIKVKQRVVGRTTTIL
jgi:hypothetical protein